MASTLDAYHGWSTRELPDRSTAACQRSAAEMQPAAQATSCDGRGAASYRHSIVTVQLSILSFRSLIHQARGGPADKSHP